MAEAPVTGGDLYSLWQAAHMGLPSVEKVYNENLKVHKDKVKGGSEETFGRCITAWHGLQAQAEFLLTRTAFSLEAAQQALDIAIDQYQYVDGDNAKGLTQAGQELKGYLDKPIHDPDKVDDDGE